MAPKLYDICHVLNYNTYYDLNLYEVGTYKCPPLYSYGPVVRNHYILHYVYSGRGMLTLDKQNYPVESRELFVMPPNVTTFYQADEHDPWNYIWLHFDGAKAVEYLRKIGIGRHRPVMHPVHEDNKISYYMEQILTHSAEEVLCIGMLYSFFHELITNTPNRKSPDNQDLHQKYAKAILDYISLKYSDHIRVRDLAGLCGKCSYCKSGLAHFCTGMVGTGATTDGGFAQYCVVHQKQVYRLPETVSFAEAAMAEPLSCCLHGVDLCDVSAGDSVAVIGGGMIGLLMVQLARLYGAGRVVLSEPVESKRDLGKKLGADLCVDPVREDPGEFLLRSGVGRVGTVIECVGNVNTIRQAIRIAGKRSVVMMFGLTKPDDEIPIKPFTLFEKEIVLKASYINPYTMPRAVQLIASGRIDVHSVALPIQPLELLAEILSDPKQRESGKVLISPW